MVGRGADCKIVAIDYFTRTPLFEGSGPIQRIMDLIARFHRWRLAETTYWLQYEQQLHQLLLSDSRCTAIRSALRDQIKTLHIAYRSRRLSELSATYSYRCTTFYDVTDVFTLCRVEAANATGAVLFGGGMLSEIRLTPNNAVTNPKSFRLERVQLIDLFIPAVVPPLAVSGWIADLEGKGIITGFGAPREALPPVSDQPAHQQYAELFAGCAGASVTLGLERFDFLAPIDSDAADAHDRATPLPILDLRELGGLAITHSEANTAQVSLLLDGVVVWSESTLVGALERLSGEFVE